MSNTNLKQVREQIAKEGIAVDLPVVKRLFQAIDEHVSEDAAVVESAVSDGSAALKEKALELQKHVDELEAQIEAKTKELASLKSAITSAEAQVAVDVKAEQAHEAK